MANSKARILIVDDEPDIRELLEITLSRMNLQTASAADITSAKALLQSQPFDLCLTDMKLPDGNGIELVGYIQQQHPDLPVAVITAYGSMDTAVDALKAGAFDFVSKPVELDRLRNLVQSAITLEQSTETPMESGSVTLVGETAVMNRLRQQIVKLGRSQAPVFISGESGSGKELVARLIHCNSSRKNGPFIPVNCGAIPSELVESEFFGHKKGSFTGATGDKLGLFQAAHGGTLFLDEVADLPLAMQVKLLRAIQEKAVRPIGGHEEHVVDVRIVSATHKDLAQEVAAGRFRSDLYYRINVIEVKVPPLRERKEDIPLLAKLTLEKLAKQWDIPQPQLSDSAQQRLSEYSFPGNVRELENILERAFTLCDGQRIEGNDLQLLPGGEASDTTDTRGLYPKINPEEAFGSLEEYLEQIEKEILLNALEQVKWNKTAAAKLLGISFRAMRYRLKKLDID